MESTDLRSLWEQRLAEYKSSGKTIAAWCQEQSIKQSQFYYWNKKILKQKPSQDTGIKWISLDLASSNKVGSESIAIHIGQVTIEIQKGFDQHLLREIIRVLQTI